MIEGVSKGFEKKLLVIGVGFSAKIDGQKLTLNLGFSHPIYIEAAKGKQLYVF